MCNKLCYYLGPKWDDHHWMTNITGDDPFLTYPPRCALPPASAPATKSVCTTTSRAAPTTSAWTSESTTGITTNVGRCTSGCGRWSSTFALPAHARPRHAEPRHGINPFDIGDLVTVEAVSDVKGGFSGAQRVYRYTISWDQDSVCEMSELQVSSDAEGLTA